MTIEVFEDSIYVKAMQNTIEIHHECEVCRTITKPHAVITSYYIWRLLAILNDKQIG